MHILLWFNIAEALREPLFLSKHEGREHNKGQG